ncbi:PHO85 cyclin PHO80 [Yarrowia sp. B02]|nr:PHO85 cyclin PHO80 [Yarrowia sp. B02]
MMAYGEPSPFRRADDATEEKLSKEELSQHKPDELSQQKEQHKTPEQQTEPEQQQYSSLITEPVETKHRESVGQVTCALSSTGLGANGRVEEEDDEISSEEELPAQSHVLLPQSFFDCPIEHLIILVSSMLEELVSVNDALPFDPAQLTRFHSRSPPGISIKDYLIRIVRFCSLEKSILLTVIYYIDFLCRTFSTFNINSLTVHRFLITTCMVGSKGLCDSFRTNGHYAQSCLK